MWADFLHRLPKADAISPDDRIEAMAIAERMSVLAAEHPFNTDDLPDAAKQAVWNAASWSDRLEAADLGWLLWSPKPGLLSLDCLSAAKATGERLRAFGHTLLMTATPGPRGSLAAMLRATAAGCAGGARSRGRRSRRPSARPAAPARRLRARAPHG